MQGVVAVFHILVVSSYNPDDVMDVHPVTDVAITASNIKIDPKIIENNEIIFLLIPTTPSQSLYYVSNM